jgi:hypothetical protein
MTTLLFQLEKTKNKKKKQKQTNICLSGIKNLARVPANKCVHSSGADKNRSRNQSRHKKEADKKIEKQMTGKEGKEPKKSKA